MDDGYFSAFQYFHIYVVAAISEVSYYGYYDSYYPDSNTQIEHRAYTLIGGVKVYLNNVIGEAELDVNQELRKAFETNGLIVEKLKTRFSVPGNVYNEAISLMPNFKDEFDNDIEQTDQIEITIQYGVAKRTSTFSDNSNTWIS